MMTKQEMIDKYKELTEEPIFSLEDGGIVVGEEADENNELLYVIRRGDEYFVEGAWNQKIKERLKVPTTETVTFTFPPHED